MGVARERARVKSRGRNVPQAGLKKRDVSGRFRRRNYRRQSRRGESSGLGSFSSDVPPARAQTGESVYSINYPPPVEPSKLRPRPSPSQAAPTLFRADDSMGKSKPASTHAPSPVESVTSRHRPSPILAQPASFRTGSPTGPSKPASTHPPSSVEPSISRHRP